MDLNEVVKVNPDLEWAVSSCVVSEHSLVHCYLIFPLLYFRFIFGIASIFSGNYMISVGGNLIPGSLKTGFSTFVLECISLF